MNTILAILGSGTLSAIVSGLFNLLHHKKERDEDIMLLLYHDIKQECKDYIAAGFVDSEGLEVLLKMHDRYHKRGGNGYLDKLIGEVKKLPIKD